VCVYGAKGAQLGPAGWRAARGGGTAPTRAAPPSLTLTLTLATHVAYAAQRCTLALHVQMRFQPTLGFVEASSCQRPVRCKHCVTSANTSGCCSRSPTRKKLDSRAPSSCVPSSALPPSPSCDYHTPSVCEIVSVTNEPGVAGVRYRQLVPPIHPVHSGKRYTAPRILARTLQGSKEAFYGTGRGSASAGFGYRL
jgi:hypothetical protein